MNALKLYIKDKAPQYGHLLKYIREDVEAIKPYLSDSKLDDELYKIKRKFDNQLKKDNQDIIKALEVGATSFDSYQEKFQKQFAKISEANKASLAEYVSSDIPFNNDQREDRTDVMILDKPVAVSDQPNTGREYETIVILELKKPMRNDYTQAENLSDEEKMNTELRSLRNTKDFFKKIIVSKTSMKPWNDDEGILHLGLYEFLLNENSLDL